MMPFKKNNNQNLTDFGFRKVLAADKDPLVKEVFDSVASKYDIMNDIMSIGIHRIWKNSLINMLTPNKYMKLVDVGGGTGDIGSRFLEQGGMNVTVVDINAKMLHIGKMKSTTNKTFDQINWVNASAEKLPLPPSYADAYTIAFCIRNVTNIETVLTEAKRVLKPGGRFLCLEFSQVENQLLKKFYDAYSFSLIPWLGDVIASDKKSYKYLAESIRQFPNQQNFAKIIQASGLDLVTYRNLSGGIATIHSAWKI